MLELFLQATRQGVLNFRWEILCPLCRGAKDGADTLGRLPTKVHCNTCNIDFNANFERSVELVFHPNEAIRQFEGGDFCVGGPQLTPHVIAQQLLQPGEGREISLPLEAGRYRLRALELEGGQFLVTGQGGSARATFVANGRGWPDDELVLSNQPTIRLENATAQEQLMILERTAWSDQAATAAEVTALQAFRDLFTSEALRPGEQISVGSLTVVFTDLRESTRLYREIGDAPAFGLVMAHFDVLRKIIVESDGAIVKTIGDSVMAVFRRPVSAVQAMMRAQQEMAAPSAGHKPLYLRVGIHHGPCVAVNLNDRFDYFGSTVNIAARLEALSTGEEVVISEAVRRDPEVAALIEQSADNLIIEPVEAALKGFEGERFEVHLLAPRVRSMVM
jgi:class 3 adenylate cyclase